MFQQLRHAVENLSPVHAHSPQQPRSGSRAKATLEERLRASFVIGDASNAGSASTSRASPALADADHALSPLSIPLPESPVASPTQEASETVSAPSSLHSLPVSEQSFERPVTPKTFDEPPPQTSQIDTSLARENNVESLQSQLRLLEQKFTAVSTSFIRLQAEKDAADAVLREYTSVESFAETDALRNYFRSSGNSEAISHLEVKLRNQEERIEELRDTHRLESRSQSQLLDKLRSDIEGLQEKLTSSEAQLRKESEGSASLHSDIKSLREELSKAQAVSKDEEEKRVKAISLLKTVRQKLVKAEKDKEDSIRELTSLKNHDLEAKNKEQEERTRLVQQLDSLRKEHEVEVQSMKLRFEKELKAQLERHDKEMANLKSQFELEAVAIRAAHSKEVSNKDAKIGTLERSLQDLTEEKNSLFDQLQLRQAEVESSRSRLDDLEFQQAELIHQARESENYVASLRDQLVEVQQQLTSQGKTGQEVDSEQLLASTELKYEAKLAVLKKMLSVAEKERAESEVQWSRKLREKIQEYDHLRQVTVDAAPLQQDPPPPDLSLQLKRAEQERNTLSRELLDLKSLLEEMRDAENLARDETARLRSTISDLEKRAEELKVRERQQNQANKTLREELKKVQSSAALLERQRNAGVGYWTSKEPSHSDAQSLSSGNGATSTEEEVNLEYLRNVILQFLEHKEMRPNLVRVLSIILRFTPQETRRLIAKV